MNTTRMIMAAMLMAMPLAAQAGPTKAAHAKPTDMTEAEKATLRDGMRNGFPYGDVNGDGKLTKQELLAYGRKQGWGSIIIERKWKAADVNKDGWLTTGEFADMLIAETNVQRAKAAARKH